MATNRDLHIGITGDSTSFDAAVTAAETKARGFDDELVKLNAEMTAQERVSAATAAAISRYGSENDKAALSARRLGQEAEQAATRAEAAVRRADAANRAYQRGLIDEEKAARASAAADRAIESAALKAAVANQAAAKAAADRAEKEKQATRDAELAAAAEELGMLKASGRVREHNALLTTLQGKYGDLSKTAVSDFERIATTGEKVGSSIGGVVDDFSILGRSGPVSIGLVAAALAALPAVASAAGGAVALGLGGGLSFIGLKAASSAVDVQNAFTTMKNDVLGDLHDISAPFHATLLEVANDAEAAFKSLEPALAGAFAQMAPAITRFTRYFAGSLNELDPAIRSIGTSFSAVLDNLGPQMPTIIGNLATGIKAITDAAAANPQALGNLVKSVSDLARYTGDTIGVLIRYSNEISTVFGAIQKSINPLGEVEGWVRKLTGTTGDGEKASAKYVNTLGTLAGTANATAVTIAHDMEVLSSSTSSASDKATALSDAFTRMLVPQAAVYSNSLQLRSSVDQLGQALAASGGRLDGATASSQKAGQAFGGLLNTAQQTATSMTKAGASIDQVQQYLGPYVNAMYKAAGSNENARALVDSFVRTLGEIPPKVDASGKVISGFGRDLGGLHVPMTGAQLEAQQLGEDMDTLASHTATASDKANALNDAFTQLLAPELAAYEDTAKLRQGIDALSAALTKSHGKLNDNSAAARDAKDKFAAVLKDAEDYAGALFKSGDSLDVVQRKLAGWIIQLYRSAGANKDARALVDAFARALQLVPNSKRTTLYSNANAAKAQVDAYRNSIDALHDKSVDIYQTFHTTYEEAVAQVNYYKRMKAAGGLIERADGGIVQHLAAGGGPSGLLIGPGSGTSDDIPAMLSNGEFVTNAAATRANLPLLQAINAGRFVSPPAVLSGTSGGAAAPSIDVRALARAVAAALDGTSVQMDSQPVGRIVSRTLGRQTDQRRRTG